MIGKMHVEPVSAAQPITGLHRVASRLPGGLAALLVVSLALHSWPAGGNPGLQPIWPVHLVLPAWMGLASILCLRSRWRERIVRAMPPACLWGYLAVCLLSVAVADHPGRAATAAGKIWVCCLATYTLVVIAADERSGMGRLAGLLCATAGLAVTMGLAQRLAGEAADGLFGSPLKLATFLAMTVPTGWAWLVSSADRRMRIAGVALACGGLVACGGVWGWAGMVAGVVVAGILWPAGRRWLAITVMSAATTLCAAHALKMLAPLRQDARLIEDDRTDIRQRYLEWQALVNLLAERPIVGAGIGCLNDHRSEYYLRLPKRNTIASFDQNGWLAAAGETGLLGLACLSAAFGHHIRLAWTARRTPPGRAVLAGLVGAVLANVGCAVQYAGLWPGVVLLMAMASCAATAAREET